MAPVGGRSATAPRRGPAVRIGEMLAVQCQIGILKHFPWFYVYIFHKNHCDSELSNLQFARGGCTLYTNTWSRGREGRQLVKQAARGIKRFILEKIPYIHESCFLNRLKKCLASSKILTRIKTLLWTLKRYVKYFLTVSTGCHTIPSAYESRFSHKIHLYK